MQLALSSISCCCCLLHMYTYENRPKQKYINVCICLHMYTSFTVHFGLSLPSLPIEISLARRYLPS